ncbi:MAG: hypothetical protein HY401_07820 [Elusimicrobia bacterium]|nr:hypothetical protein [Elusimicrobiota bacterium]
MELDFAFLADAAEVTNGKLYVIGGAFDTLCVRELPASWPRLTLVMRFLLTPAESGRPHALEIIVLDEDGKKIVNLSSSLNVERPPNMLSGTKQSVPIALNFFNARFDKKGSYSIEILVNGTSLKSIPLKILLQKPPAETLH